MALLAKLALVPAVFAAHPGWHVGHGPVRACPGVAASRCVQAASWAATVAWKDCGGCLPQRTIDALPPDGVALQVEVSVEHPLARRTATWPPVIRARDVGGGLEGISQGISPRYGVWQLFARFGDVDAYVFAFFGRAQPTPAQLAAANAELRTVRLHG